MGERVNINNPDIGAIHRWSSWLMYLLSAQKTEGADGLYFRAAQVVAALTEAKHAIMVVPSAPGILRVAGCWGFPTAALQEFPDTQGIIGRTFRQGFQDHRYLIVNDVSVDPDYHSFDECVRSELLVPVYDANRAHVTAILNVESNEERHFTHQHAEMVFGLTDILSERRRQLEVCDEFTKEIECLKTVLEEIPDELLIIDDHYRPVYANKVKRDRIKRLRDYLGDRIWGWCEGFLTGRGPLQTAHPKSCHELIEGQPEPCEGCVCKKAVDCRKPMEGIIYQPHWKPSRFLELSAAPLYSSASQDAIIGCIEIARDVTHREKVLNLATDLFEGYDESQLLRSIVELLREEVGYDRVRLYSVAPMGELHGMVYTGRHDRFPEREFLEFKVKLPRELSEWLPESRKAGLLNLSEPSPKDECLGYWAAGIGRDELADFVDPDGRLELTDVAELAAVPIRSGTTRWLLFLDSKYSKEKFTSEDLQALTVFSRLSSAALTIVRQNKLRFRFAALGETTVGLRHALDSALEPQQLRSEIIWPLREVLSMSIQYLRQPSSKQRDHILADVLARVADLASGQTKPRLKGECVALVSQLMAKLRGRQGWVPSEDILFELARLGDKRELRLNFWEDAITKVSEEEFWLLVVNVGRAVAMLHQLTQASDGLDVYSKAFATIVEDAERQEVPVLCDLRELVEMAFKASAREAGKHGVDVKHKMCSEALPVRVRRGEIFLALRMLIQNGIQAAGVCQQGGTVGISTATATDGDSAVVTVTNNGTKIPEQYYRRVFLEPFSTKEDGTGFGLIFAHDWITSDVNAGEITTDYGRGSDCTTFEVRFEISRDAHVPPMKEAEV